MINEHKTDFAQKLTQMDTKMIRLVADQRDELSSKLETLDKEMQGASKDQSDSRLTMTDIIKRIEEADDKTKQLFEDH